MGQVSITSGLGQLCFNLIIVCRGGIECIKWHMTGKMITNTVFHLTFYSSEQMKGAFFNIGKFFENQNLNVLNHNPAKTEFVR